MGSTPRRLSPTKQALLVRLHQNLPSYYYTRLLELHCLLLTLFLHCTSKNPILLNPPPKKLWLWWGRICVICQLATKRKILARLSGKGGRPIHHGILWKVMLLPKSYSDWPSEVNTQKLVLRGDQGEPSTKCSLPHIGLSALPSKSACLKAFAPPLLLGVFFVLQKLDTRSTDRCTGRLHVAGLRDRI